MRTWLIALTVTAGATAFMAIADPLPPDASYRPLPTEPLDVVRRNDEAEAAVMRRQQSRAELRSGRSRAADSRAYGR